MYSKKTTPIPLPTTWLLMFAWLPLLPPACSCPLVVLQTTSDMSQFVPGSWAEILNSSLLGHTQVSLCARFYIYKFTNDYTNIFGFGSSGSTMFSKWTSLGAIQGLMYAGNENTLPMWDPGVWNSVCVILDSDDKFVKVVMNGETVLIDNEYTSIHHKSNESLTIMALPEPYGYSSSMFGRMTDVNLWSRSLTEGEAEAWTGVDCQSAESSGGGDLVDWGTAAWRMSGLKEGTVERGQLCRMVFPRYLVNPVKSQYYEAVHYASMLGELAMTDDSKPLLEMTNVLANESVWENCATGFWLTDRGDCTVIQSDGKVHNLPCSDQHCSLILLPALPKYQLRGVCQGSQADSYYVLQIDSYREMIGFKQTKLTWSNESKRWDIVNQIDKTVLAFSNSTESFPFGTHRWFFNDERCTDPDQTWRTMNLQQFSEQPGHFCCDDGLCIDSENRCDNKYHCKDESDEIGCNIVQVSENTYNRNMPPSRIVMEGKERAFLPSEVRASVRIQDILGMDEAMSTFSLEFNMDFKWTDSRLKFNFLKTDNNSNMIADPKENIWIPDAIFLRLKGQSNPIIMYEHTSVEKKGTAKMSAGMDVLQANETYEGADNPITISSVYQGDFICSFDTIWYPFDNQKCSVKTFLNSADADFVYFSPQKIIDKGPSKVGQYQVKGWVFEKITLDNGKKGLVFSVQLERNVLSIFFITYLPTILMNLINQATNYFDENFDLLLTINITCMMVLASVYISVSSSLPVTAEIKFVEIWLLFNLAYPVLVILVNIALKVTKNMISKLAMLV